ncbi:MAG: DNA/RNA nuclease SfsA [Deltaproteobacteria bacterium]|nr:DNA/RNA nuclease SfsA [Deltaproteobacteria bacterium]
MDLDFLLPWPSPLEAGRLVRRLHRHLADVLLDDGRPITASCINRGPLEGLVRPGARVWVRAAPDPADPLAYAWCATESDGVRVGIDPSLPHRLVRAMLEARALPRMGPYEAVRPEYPHAAGSRVDFRLTAPGTVHDVEVKHCQLVYPDRRGYFPDGVSARATRHLQALVHGCRRGVEATVLFVVQREDARSVRPSDVHDPAFGAAARRAAAAGVRFRALRVTPACEGLRVLGTLPVDLDPYGQERPARWRASLRPHSGWERLRA